MARASRRAIGSPGGTILILRGLPDFQDSVAVIDGRAHSAFGTGGFLVLPNGVRVAKRPDGTPRFRLDIVRPAALFLPPAPYATLDISIAATFPDEAALAELRRQAVGATLAPIEPTGGIAWLRPMVTSAALPADLLVHKSLAWNGLGETRFALQISTDGASLVERMLLDGASILDAGLELEVSGVSPRLPTAARFNPKSLIGALAGAADASGLLSWSSLVDRLRGESDGGAVSVEATVGSGQERPLAETMADRVLARFCRYAFAGTTQAEPWVALPPAESIAPGDFRWDLSEPAPARRRFVLTLNPFTAIRDFIAEWGTTAVVSRTVSQVIPIGTHALTVLANLPRRRLGVAALGATLTAPARPPHRPHPAIVTVEFEPPEDTARTMLRLSPGEPLRFEVQSFAMIADDSGVRRVSGPARSQDGAIVALGPADFAVRFVVVEAMPDLLTLATLHGVCRHGPEGEITVVGIDLDASQDALALALPLDAEDASLEFEVRERGGDRSLALGPLAARSTRIGLASFPEYGPHEVEITCIRPADRPLCALDLLPEGRPETAEEITTLTFTPDIPTRAFAWFARSPFAPGFHYRPHAAPGLQTVPWRLAASPFDPLEVVFE